MISSEQPSEDDGPRLLSIIRGGKDQTPRDAGAASSEAADSLGRRKGVGGSDPSEPGSRHDAEDDPSEPADPEAGQASGPEETGPTAAAVPIDVRATAEEGDDADAIEAIAARATALLDDADPVAYYRALKGLVREGHSSVLAPLDYSEEYAFHQPSRVFVDPVPSSVDTALLYARAAYPEFEEVLLPGFTDPARRDLLVALYDLLFVERRNVALVTNHGQIIDIALVMAALFIAMLAEETSFGVLGERVSLEEMAERSNTLVSRMVATRQAFGIPAVQVLQSITRVFLSVPQTASRRRAKLDPTLVKANNSLMRFELEKRLAHGGQILAMAASGTQDLTIPQLMSRARAAWRHRRGDDPGEEPTLHLQPIYNGTVSLMRSCDYVLPVAISLDHKAPAIAVGTLTRLHEDEDCHRIMDWIALAHQEATGIPTIYHRPGDDLLTQVRSLIAR